MKLRTLAATAILGAASLTSAHAQATDPCTVFVCMAGVAGLGPGGGACSAAISYWSLATPAGLAVYDYPSPPYFDPPSSAAYRQAYMQSCPAATLGTNATILATVISTIGYLP